MRWHVHQAPRFSARLQARGCEPTGGVRLWPRGDLAHIQNDRGLLLPLAARVDCAVGDQDAVPSVQKARALSHRPYGIALTY